MLAQIPRYSVMAVVDKRGYLVPIFTAGDLLSHLKMLWNARRIKRQPRFVSGNFYDRGYPMNGLPKNIHPELRLSDHARRRRR
jgi:hypothetical protein